VLAVVTGASGLLGGNLAIGLIAEGHRVRATRRDTSRVDHLAAFPLEWSRADLSDRRALADAFAAADVVFHCAAAVSTVRRVTSELVAANVDGTANVLAAAEDAGVRRVVHCSTAATVGLSEDGRPSTESARWNLAERGMVNGYVVTKRKAETLVLDRVREGLDAVVVNPTFMLGPYDARPSSGRLIVDVATRRLPVHLPGFNNFVDVRDVARGMIAAWRQGRAGERYILGGEDRSYRDIIECIAESAAVDPPRWPLPRAVAVLLGLWGDGAERLGHESSLNSVTVRYGFAEGFRFSSAKAEAELEYAPRPISEAIRDAIAWFRAHGRL